MSSGSNTRGYPVEAKEVLKRRTSYISLGPETGKGVTILQRGRRCARVGSSRSRSGYAVQQAEGLGCLSCPGVRGGPAPSTRAAEVRGAHQERARPSERPRAGERPGSRSWSPSSSRSTSRPCRTCCQEKREARTPGASTAPRDGVLSGPRAPRRANGMTARPAALLPSIDALFTDRAP